MTRLFHQPPPRTVLEDLQALDEFNKRNVQPLEENITIKGPGNRKFAIETILNDFLYLDIFKLTVHSPIIDTFCREKRYEKYWQIHLNEINRSTINFTIQPNTNHSPLDRVMGFALARELNNRWVQNLSLAEQPNDLEALYRAIQVRGVTDPDIDRVEQAVRASRPRA